MIRVFSLRPLTPLLLRSFKPFEIGGRAESLRFPSPSTLVGMIRSIIWESQGKNFDPQLLANEKNFTGVVASDGVYYSTYNFKWRLIGPYLYRTSDPNKGVYYPAPLDIFVIENRNEIIMPDKWSMNELNRLFGTIGVPMFRMDQHKLQISMEGKIKRLIGSFIHMDDLKRIINTEYNGSSMQNVRVCELDKIVKGVEEAHVAIDHTKKIVQIDERGKGHYFTVRRLILEDGWVFVFGIISLDKSIDRLFDHLDGKIARFGGEGGRVLIREEENIKLIEHDYIDKLDDTVPSRLRLILTNPAVFLDSHGLDSPYPQTPNASKLRYFAIKSTLVGGWDYVRNLPKPLHRGVDMSSVYCYELESKELTYRDLMAERKHIPDEFRGAYGSVLVGIW